MDDPLARIKDARRAQHQAHRDLMVAVEDALDLGCPKAHIAEAMEMSRMTVYRFIEEREQVKQEEERPEPPLVA